MRYWKTTSNYIITQLLGGRSNVFLLSNGEKNILVDTGTKGQWRKLLQRLVSLNLSHIDYLILTHTHNDHAANAKKLKKMFEARVIVHRNEADYLATGCPVIPKGTNIYSRMLTNLFGERATPWFRYDPCPCDSIVDDFYSLEDIGFNAYLLYTPGHSSGSISLVVDNEIALLGDVMIGRGSRYTYPPFADDPVELMRSWKKLLDTGCNLFIPSHGWANKRSLVEKVFIRKIKKLRLQDQITYSETGGNSMF